MAVGVDGLPEDACQIGAILIGKVLARALAMVTNETRLVRPGRAPRKAGEPYAGLWSGEDLCALGAFDAI